MQQKRYYLLYHEIEKLAKKVSMQSNYKHKKTSTHKKYLYKYVVQMVGLEPTWVYTRQILSLFRLPISAHLQMIYRIIT